MKRICLALGLAVAALPVGSCSKEAKKARVLHRADAYFKAGDFDKAKVEYWNLFRLAPQDPLPYKRLGFIWYEEGAPLRAVPFYLKLRELAPDDLESRVKLGRVLLSLGQNSEAYNQAMAVLARSPADAEAARVAAEAAQNPDQKQRVDQALSRMTNHQNDLSFQLAVATAALRKGDKEGATKAVHAALALDPKSVTAHALLGTLYLADRQVDKAGPEFKTAAELSPPRSWDRLRFAQFQIQSGATDAGRKTLQSITENAPDFLPAWISLAELSLARKNYDEASKLLANVLNRDADSIDAGLLQARAWMGKGDMDKAKQVLEGLDAKYSNVPTIKIELARFYVQKNNVNQAIETLNQVVAANPDFVEGALLLGQLNLRARNAQPVLDAMLPLTAKHPDLAAARYLLADAYRILGQFEEAAGVLREEVKRMPQSAEAHLALGIVLRQQQKPDEARQELERARQLSPGSPGALTQLVDFYLDGHDFATARRLVETQMNTTPSSPTVYFLEAKIFAAQQQWQQAEASLKKALNLNRDYSGAYGLLATIYLATNKLPEAAKQLEELHSRNPEDTGAMMTLGAVYEKLGSFDKARDMYQKLLSVQSEFAPALNNLAFTYAEHLNDVDRGYQLAQKARTLQPGDGSIADTLGWILYKKRDYQQALSLLREAAAKVPNDAEIQYHVGMCCYMMGDTEPARLAFQQALNSGGDFPQKAEVVRRLSLLSTEQAVGQQSTQELQAIVKQQPDDVLARAALAGKYMNSGMANEAAAEYQEVLKLNPKFVQALVKLAEIYSTTVNEQAKALEYARRARELSPLDPHVTLLLGRIAYNTGSYSWAYSLLQQAAGQLRDDPAAIHALGWAAFSVANVAEAKEQMQRVLELGSGGAEAQDAERWLAMMRLVDQKTFTRQEVESVTAVLNKDGNYVPALLARAAMATKNGDTKSAVSLYRQVLSRFPDYGPAQARLAALYAAQPATLNQAYDLAVKARKTLPDDPELARILADIDYQRKDYTHALELLHESARKEPLDANHLYYMGICSLQVKDTSHAREALTQALATGLQDPFATEAKRTLQQIK